MARRDRRTLRLLGGCAAALLLASCAWPSATTHLARRSLSPTATPALALLATATSLAATAAPTSVPTIAPATATALPTATAVPAPPPPTATATPPPPTPTAVTRPLGVQYYTTLGAVGATIPVSAPGTVVTRDGGATGLIGGNLVWMFSDTLISTAPATPPPGFIPGVLTNTFALAAPTDPLRTREPLDAKACRVRRSPLPRLRSPTTSRQPPAPATATPSGR